MHRIVIVLTILTACLGLSEEIRNDTAEPMLCSAFYPAEFKEEVLYGIKQRIQVKKEERIADVLQPGKSFTKTGRGSVKCYNKQSKIESYEGRGVTTLSDEGLKSHIITHEMFDIGSYVNADRAQVESLYGISQRCEPYKGGEYCNRGNGLDILYDGKGRVSKLFLYGNALQNGRLPFVPESLHQLYANDEPLGLWVSGKNRALIGNKPTLQTESVIVWEKPAPMIERIVMTPQNGYRNGGGFRYRGPQADPSEERLKAIEIVYTLDDKAYSAQKQRLPHADTWGAYLNPSGQIPKNRFKAFYINTKEPKKVIASEVVSKVSVNYPWDQFHGIKSEDFGGYWAGNFVYDTETTMQISLEQSWSKARVIIDGKVVYEGGSNAQFPYTFKQGENKIEVEYINNWHTTGFMMTIKPKELKYDRDALQNVLKKTVSADAEILLAGVYESSQQDQSITLKLAKQNKPVILVLSSYSGVNWMIQNPHKNRIEAVVYSAYNPGTEISGDLPSSIPVLAYEGRMGSYTMSEQCDCHGAIFHCEGNNGTGTIAQVESVIGKKILGYSGKYAADVLLLPQIPVTKEHLEKLRNERQTIEQQRDACRKEINPDFNKLFQK